MGMAHLWVTMAVMVSFSMTIAMASDADPLKDFCVADLTTNLTINGYPCKPHDKVTFTDFHSTALKFTGDTNNSNKVATTPAFDSTFPALNTLGISFVRIDLAKGGVNPPHTHPRASEIVLVVKGELYAGFVDTNNTLYAGILKAGELVVIPRGLIHFQLNVGKGDALAYAAFNSQNPRRQVVAEALFGSGVKEEVLEKAFRVSEQTVEMIQKEFQG